MTPAYGCVVLTAGRRPDDLRRAVESLLRQRDVALDVVVVGNGCEPAGVPDGVPVVAAGARRRHPGRPQRGRAARAGRAALLPRRRRGDRRRRRAGPRGGAVRRRPGARARPARAAGARARRAPLARLGAAAARRRPAPAEREHGRVGGRGGDPPRGLGPGGPVAGRVPLRARGRRPRLAAHGRGLDACATRATSRCSTPRPRGPRTAIRTISVRATECGSRAATCRCRSGSSS